MPRSRSKKRAKTPSLSGRKKATSTSDIQKRSTTRIYDGNGIMTWVHYLLGHDKPLLSKHGAESLILWSYTSSPDPSKLAPILYPFWVKFAYFFPSWWSPNLVTVSGFFTMFSMFLVVQKLCGGETGWTIPNDASEAPPEWLFPVAGIALWLYQTADAVDGRQGKRVGMYVHPSTELFDHGIDSIVTSLVGITMATGMRLGHGVWTALFLAGAWCVFYATTWEHLNVGKMRFQSGLSNPTEALTLIVIVLLLVGFYPGIWEVRVVDLWTSIVPEFARQLISAVLNGVFDIISSVITIHFEHLKLKHVAAIAQFQNGILSVFSSAMVIRRDPRKGITGTIAMSNLLPLILVVLWVFMMFCLDVEQKIMIEFAQHGRLLLVLGAATWNYATLTLIICEMGKQKYPTAKVISIILSQLYLMPLVAFFLPGPVKNFMLQLYPDFNSVFVLKFWTAVSLLRFISLWLCYQNELCHYCGMENWYTIQVWTGTEDGPNKARLDENIEYLGKNSNGNKGSSNLISDWGKRYTKNARKKRIQALLKKEMVELW